MTRPSASAHGSAAGRWLVHDFGGYSFVADFSRSLARGGHDVVHAHCGGVASGKGALECRPGDPGSLRFVDVQPEPFERYSTVARLAGEVRYGARLARLVRRERPSVIISANAPVLSQAMLWVASRSIGATRLYWLQDFLGRGVRSVLTERSAVLGATAGRLFEGIESLVLRTSHGVVAISEDFVEPLRRRSVRCPVLVVENWAPVDEIRVSPKSTAWSREHGLADRPVALYAGTLGLKHDPEHLLAVARSFEGSDAVLVVVTEGLGRARLERARREEGLSNLLLLDYLPHERMGDLFGCADVCLVLLEPEAGGFSVPSKVLTYLASGRAVVGAMPRENLAARTVVRAGAGVLLRPGDHDRFATAVLDLIGDSDRRQEMGDKGLRHAAAHFDADVISDRLQAFATTARATGW